MNSKPKYRFFLGGQLITEPIGWNTVLLVLERDTQFWSLVESVEQPFEFVADGYDYIKDARRNGINAQITFESDISWDAGVTWEDFFNGLLDLTTLLEIENKRRYQCTLLRTGAWSKLINRRGTQVNIWGKADSNTTNLPSQVIQKVLRAETYPVSDSNAALITFNTTTTNKYAVIDLNKVVTDELEIRYSLANGVQSSPVIPPFLKAKEAGDYAIDIEIWLVATSTILSEYPQVDMYIQFGEAAPIALTQTNFGTDGLDGAGRYTYTATPTLAVGETVKLWIQDDSGVSNTTFLSPLYPEISFIEIVADTVAEDTEAEGFFIHDATRAIVNEISEDPEYFYSEYFGGSMTEDIEYADSGCGMAFKLFKGINVRGESLDDNPFTFSLDDMWQGIDNIFCLGCGYEVVSFVSDGQPYSKEVVRIEPREYFFDDSSNSIELDGFNWDDNLEISYDPQFLMTAIKIGFEKWEAETLVGTDDPQTVHDYSTILKTVGAKDAKDKKILSGFYAASSGIETTRRKTFEPRKDWRLDQDTFIIQTDMNTGVVRQYLGGTDVTNLLNDSTRYNVRLTPANNFIKWGPWLSIAFQDYPEQLFYFVGGDGNINMIYDNQFAEDCDLEWGNYVSERANREIVDSPFLPFVYKFSCPFNWEQWKAVRDNRRKAIKFTYKNNEGEQTEVQLFIRSMKYDPSRSGADFECWLKFNITEGPYSLFTSYNEFVGGTPSWQVVYDNNSASDYDTHSVNFVGSGSDTDPNGLRRGNGAIVFCSVSKLSNGGIAQGSGSDGVRISFKLNGVQQQANNFLPGADCSLTQYSFTGLTGGDAISVVITEGI